MAPGNIFRIHTPATSLAGAGLARAVGGAAGAEAGAKEAAAAGVVEGAAGMGAHSASGTGSACGPTLIPARANCQSLDNGRRPGPHPPVSAACLPPAVLTACPPPAVSATLSQPALALGCLSLSLTLPPLPPRATRSPLVSSAGAPRRSKLVSIRPSASATPAACGGSSTAGLGATARYPGGRDGRPRPGTPASVATAPPLGPRRYCQLRHFRRLRQFRPAARRRRRQFPRPRRQRARPAAPRPSVRPARWWVGRQGATSMGGVSPFHGLWCLSRIRFGMQRGGGGGRWGERSG